MVLSAVVAAVVSVRRFSVGLALVVTAAHALARCGGTAPPTPLAIFYSSSPWAVDGCPDALSPRAFDCAAAALGHFTDVVMTGGLEDPTNAAHLGVSELLPVLHRRDPKLRVWGYVSAVGGPVDDAYRRQVVYGTSDVVAHAHQWSEMGAGGIFLDELNVCPRPDGPCSTGPDGRPASISCAHIDEIIDALHSAGLPVFANGGSADDLLGSCDGRPTRLGPGGSGRAADVYLVENPTVAGGTVVPADAGSASRLDRAARLASDAGARLAVVDTGGAGPVLSDPRRSSALEQQGWQAAARVGASIYCYTNEYYSAPGDVQRDLALPGPTGVTTP